MKGNFKVMEGQQLYGQHNGIYHATVHSNNDPLGQGRIKLRIPQVIGTAISNWAAPTSNDGIIPSNGQKVYAMFNGGDVNYPIYFGASTYTDGIFNVLNTVFAGGADPTGKSDSTNAINSALAAASKVGGTVFFPTGTYGITTALNIPSGVSVVGSGAVNPVYSSDVGTVIKPLASFSGGSVIFLNTPSHTQTPGVSLRHFAIDCSAVTTGIDGIFAEGPMYLVRIEDLWITNCTGFGIQTAKDNSVISGAVWPFWWWVRDVMIENCESGGILITSMTDSTWTNVYVIQCGVGTSGHGWVIDWAGNSQFTNCRAEWSGGFGLWLTGAWWTGTGAGGCTFTGFSTDRNNWDGVKIDATGNGPILFDNLMLRRDGRNNKLGGGSFSGFNIAASTVPIIVGTMSVFPGVDDDGTGVESPEYGISVTGNPFASIGSGYVQAASTAINDTHAGGFFSIGAGMITAVGTPSSPGSYTGQTVTGYTEYTNFAQFKNSIFADAGIDIDVAGQGIAVKEGSNAKQGIVTLNGTSDVTVTNSSITSTSRIFLSIQSPGAVTPGVPYVTSRAPGISFNVKSTAASDNSVIAYEIFEAG